MYLVKCIELKQHLDSSMMSASTRPGIEFNGVLVRLPSILLWPDFHVREFLLFVHLTISIVDKMNIFANGSLQNF